MQSSNSTPGAMTARSQTTVFIREAPSPTTTSAPRQTPPLNYTPAPILAPGPTRGFCKPGKNRANLVDAPAKSRWWTAR
jgi:hypothetical protein